MELNINELNLIISALKLAQFPNQDAETKMLLHKMTEEQGDLMAEEHAEKAAKLMKEIRTACKWANEDTIMEYALEWASDESASPEHFKKTIVG